MERKFVEMHPMPKAGNITIQINPGSSSSLVERNRNGMVMIMWQNIQQSNVVIGYFSKKSQATGGNIVTEIEIFLPGGQRIARATAVGATSHHWDVVTMKDNKAHHIDGSLGHDEKDIATYLIGLMYL